METTYYLNGKKVSSQDEIPANAKRGNTVTEIFYYTEEFKSEYDRKCAIRGEQQKRFQEYIDLRHKLLADIDASEGPANTKQLKKELNEVNGALAKVISEMSHPFDKL